MGTRVTVTGAALGRPRLHLTGRAWWALSNTSFAVVQYGPAQATFGPVVTLEFERIEALELLAMTLAHLNDAESKGEVSPRVPLLMSIRDKFAYALREES